MPQIVQQAEAQKVTPAVTTETPPATPATPTTPTTPTATTPPATTPPKTTTPTVATGQVTAPPTIRDTATVDKLNKYSAMSSQQFLDLMKQGQIPSALSSQLVANPQYQQAQQEYSEFLKTNNINTSGKAVFNAMTG